MGHPPPAWAPEQHLPDHARSPPREPPLRGGAPSGDTHYGQRGSPLRRAAPLQGSVACPGNTRLGTLSPPTPPPTPPKPKPRTPCLHHAPPPPPRPSTPTSPLHPRLAPPQTLKKDLAGAIIDPQTTGFCLEQILTTTFVNSMDGTSLAFIMPVIIRGLRDPTYDLVKKAVTCAGNMCVPSRPNPHPRSDPNLVPISLTLTLSLTLTVSLRPSPYP